MWLFMNKKFIDFEIYISQIIDNKNVGLVARSKTFYTVFYTNIGIIIFLICEDLYN